MSNLQESARSGTAHQDEKVERSRLVLLGLLSATAAGSGCSSASEMEESANLALTLTSGSFKQDGKTYSIVRNRETGETTYHETSGQYGRGISEAEYYAAAAKRDAGKKKPTITPVADTPTMGGEGGGGGSH